MMFGFWGGHWGAASRARPSKPVWPTLRRAGTLLRPHRMTVVFYLLTVAITSTVGLGPPLLIRPILDQAIPSGDMHQLGVLSVLMLVLVTVGALVGVLLSYLSNIVGQEVVFDLRMTMYRHLSG